MNRRVFLISGLALLATGCTPRGKEIVVGSKNFTEQLILGELLAQWLSRKCAAPIERRFYLAGTYICQQAILSGRIDTYVEYTGTALSAVLKESYSGDPDSVYARVKTAYQKRFNLEVMAPLGFNNTFAMIIRGEDARRMGISKLSQLSQYAPQMNLGVGYEFLERKDGYQGLVRTYNLKFAEAPRVMDLGLLYRALENRSVDIVAGNNTDGLIEALGLLVLEDDKHYFPPYDAVPIVKPEMLQHFPASREAFAELAGRITADQMRKMNYAVDGKKEDAAQVVSQFLVNNFGTTARG